LVNNAGYGLVGAFEDLSIDEIKNQYETNVFGLMRVTQAVLPIMRRQKSGIIVNVSSGQGYLVILEVQPMLVPNLLLKV
jgi:short-subunit dehydrogenase